MKIDDIRAKTDHELDVELTKLAREIFELRIKGQLDTSGKSGRVREARRDIARIKTILRQRLAARA
jgi:large subunit ribosomal protein L29